MPLRRRLLPLVLLVAAGCGGGARAGLGPDPSRLADVTWDSAAAPDSIAGWALEGCRRRLGGPSRECVERALYRVIEQAGITTAMRALDRAVEREARLGPDAHGLAHGLGIAAYRSPETVAATFAGCTRTQMSGCFHGVIQGYFLDLARQGAAPTGETLDALCAPHAPDIFLYFHCVHGVGHGVLSLTRGHLPRALEVCDLASDAYFRESCYTGAFMENSIAFTHPHHSGEAHAAIGGEAHGDDGGHAHHAASDEPRWKPLDPGEPLYPCTVVAERYRYACYTFQASSVLFLSGGQMDAVARACRRAPEAYRQVCFESLGREVMSVAAKEHAKSIRLCAHAGEAGEGDCLAGVAMSLVNGEGDPGAGMRFCAELPDEATKGPCYRGVGRIIVTLAPGEEARERHCAAAEPAGVEPCRAGAGLRPKPEGGNPAQSAQPSSRRE
jgi:hypothetical protein